MPDLDIPTQFTCRLELVFQLGSRVWEHRLFFRSGGYEWTLAAVSQLAAAGGNWVINHYLPLLSNEVLFIKSIATDVSRETAGSITITYAGYYGGVDSPSEPVSVCALAATYDRFDGPRRGGRVLVAGVPKSVVLENSLDPTWCDNLFEAFVWLIDTGIGAFAVYWGWVSFRVDGAWREEGLFRTVDHIAVRTEVFTRRTRKKNLPH